MYQYPCPKPAVNPSLGDARKSNNLIQLDPPPNHPQTNMPNQSSQVRSLLAISQSPQTTNISTAKRSQRTQNGTSLIPRHSRPSKVSFSSNTYRCISSACLYLP